MSLPAPSVRHTLLFDNSHNEEGGLRRRFPAAILISLGQYDLYGLYDKSEYGKYDKYDKIQYDKYDNIVREKPRIYPLSPTGRHGYV